MPRVFAGVCRIASRVFQVTAEICVTYHLVVVELEVLREMDSGEDLVVLDLDCS
jgi:hypothetical protein